MAVDTAEGVISHIQADLADVRDSQYLAEIAPLEPEPGDLEYEAAKKISDAGLATLTHEVSQQNNPKHSFYKISSYISLLFALKETITKNVIGLAVIDTQGASDD